MNIKYVDLINGLINRKIEIEMFIHNEKPVYIINIKGKEYLLPHDFSIDIDIQFSDKPFSSIRYNYGQEIPEFIELKEARKKEVTHISYEYDIEE